jgi:hypothetical protein
MSRIWWAFLRKWEIHFWRNLVTFWRNLVTFWLWTVKKLLIRKLYETVCEAETIRQRQYEEFVQQRFRERSVSICDPIPSNKLSLFSLPPVREHSKS